MSYRPKWGGRTDENHRKVRDGLRKHGCSVADTSAAGFGFPDLVVGFRGVTLLVEVKNPKTRKVGGKATRGTQERQAKFREKWKGAPILVVYSLEEAWEKIQTLTEAA